MTDVRGGAAAWRRPVAGLPVAQSSRSRACGWLRRSIRSRNRAFGPLTVGAGGAFSGLSVDNVRGSAAGVPWAYDVTAKDLAGNTITVPVSGLAYR